MQDCLFCKIIAKEIPSYMVGETEQAYAFLDIHPLNPGHTLIVPKKHYRWLWDMKNIEVGELFQFAYTIAQAQRSVFHTDWIASQVLGMGVHHAHVHLIPRTIDDKHKGENINPAAIQKLSEHAMEEIAKQLQQALLSA